MIPSPNRRVAVALAWERGSAAPPTVVAKGRGAVADRIVAVAKEHGVALEGDPLLAAVLSELELDDPIPEELFRAVAEVLSFVLGLRRRGSPQRRQLAPGDLSPRAPPD